MNKSEKIVKFIRDNNPRRKDLVRFIAVELNQFKTNKEWDELPNSNKSGYYGTNINKWKNKGNIEVDPKTKRYSMSKYYKGHLYGLTNKFEVEGLKQRSIHWKALAENYRIENNRLLAKNKKLTEALRKISEIIN